MPAIVQVFLVLTVLGADGSARSWREVRSRWSRLALLGVAMVLFLGCLFSATLMVVRRESSLQAGRLAVMDGNRIRAERLFAQAAQADPLSPAPYTHRAALAFESWSRSAGDEAGEFAAGVAAQREAIRRDPYHFSLYAGIGSWYLEKYRRERDGDDARQAVEALESATGLYPYQVKLQSQLAEALAAAGQPDSAAEAAAEALSLDEINHRHGHQDKYLTPDEVERLRHVAQPKGPSQ